MFAKVKLYYENLNRFYSNPIVRRALRGGRVVIVSYALYQAGNFWEIWYLMKRVALKASNDQ